MEAAHMNIEIGSNSNLVLKVNKAPGFMRYALVALTIAAFLVPIISTVYAIFFSEEPHLAYLIIPIAFGYAGICLLKTYLWGSFGQEQMQFSKEGFSYKSSYRYFTGPEKRLEYPYYLNYRVVWESDTQIEAILSVYNEKGVVSSGFKLPIDEVEKLYLELCEELPWLNEGESYSSGHLLAG